MKIDVIYARVSTEEQKRKETIKGQVTVVEKTCAGQGVTVGRIYADEGVSGSTPLHRRRDGLQLLQDARAGLLRRVWTWKYDRMSRNLRDFLNLMGQLEEYGVQVISITQPLPDGPAGKLMLQMLGAFAELNRNNIRENTMRGCAAKAASGGYAGGWVAFGLRVEGVKRTARLVPHPKYAPLVRSLFEKYDQGKTCSDLARDLNQRAVPPVRGAALWRPNSILSILRNTISTELGPSASGYAAWTNTR
jgi:site-specific DNA recombinase